MMARSKSSNQRPDTLTQDRLPPDRRKPLATRGRTMRTFLRPVTGHAAERRAKFTVRRRPARQGRSQPQTSRLARTCQHADHDRPKASAGGAISFDPYERDVIERLAELPTLWLAHAPPHRAARQKCRRPVLGMFAVSLLHGHAEPRCCTGFPCSQLGQWLRCRYSLCFDRITPSVGYSRLVRRWLPRDALIAPKPALSLRSIVARSHDPGFLERDELATAGQRDRVIEGAGPTHRSRFRFISRNSVSRAGSELNRSHAARNFFLAASPRVRRMRPSVRAIGSSNGLLQPDLPSFRSQPYPHGPPKLGFEVAQSSVTKYMVKRRGRQARDGGPSCITTRQTLPPWTCSLFQPSVSTYFMPSLSSG